MIGGGVTADRRGNSILPTVSSYLIEPIGRPLCTVVCILFSDNNEYRYYSTVVDIIIVDMLTSSSLFSLDVCL